MQFVTGLASACSLFLVASGLSIIFGVTRIVNFAHGAFYMLGAYVGYTLIDKFAGTLGFWGAEGDDAMAMGQPQTAPIGHAVEYLDAGEGAQAEEVEHRGRVERLTAGEAEANGLGGRHPFGAAALRLSLIHI